MASCKFSRSIKTPPVKKKGPKQQFNVLPKLHFREIYGSLRKNHRTQTQKIFNKIPGRLGFQLTSLVDETVLQNGHVFLGFTKDGQFVLSYTLTVEAEENTAYPTNVYRLQWWHFVPHKPLVKVAEVRLFGEEEIVSDLYIAVCQWPTDNTKILVYGYCVVDDGEEKRQCYITLTAIPPIKPCDQCICLQTERENAPDEMDVEESDSHPSMPRCLRHGLTVHTKYELAPPYPSFAPKTVLKIDGVVILNTGDSLMAISIELTHGNQPVFRLFSPRPSEGSAEEDDMFESSARPSKSSGNETPSVYDYIDSQVCSPVGMYIDCTSDMRSGPQRKSYKSSKVPLSPAHNSQNTSNPNSPRTFPVPLSPGRVILNPVSPLSPRSSKYSPMSPSPSHMCQDNGGMVSNFETWSLNHGKLKDSDSSQGKAKGNPVLFSHPRSDDEAYFIPADYPNDSSQNEDLFDVTPENHDITYKSPYSVSESSEEFSGNQENQLPAGLQFSDDQGQSSGTDDGDVFSPSSSYENRARLNTRALPRLVCNVDQQSIYSHSNHSIPRTGPAMSPSINSLGRQEQASTTSSAVSSPIILQNDTECFTYSVRRYTEPMGGIMELLPVEEDDLSIAYHSILPLEVHGAGYSNMRLHTSRLDDTKRGLIVKQLTLDVEQYIADTIRNEAEWGGRYIAFTDYDMQIIDVCPDSYSVIVMVLALIQARPPSFGHVARKCFPNIYQTGFKFVWNLQTGSHTTLDIEGLEEFDQAQLMRREWCPGHAACVKLQKQFIHPQATTRSVGVLTNEAVFKGQSLKMLLDPQNYVAILMRTPPSISAMTSNVH